MPRVKGGTTTRRRRKKILKLAKGYFGSKRALYRTAHEQVMRSLAYAYRDRKQRKREFRKLWITRINAAAKLNGMKYSKLIHGLALANVQVNRKMLADIAINQPEDFKAYCALAQAALEGYIPPKTEVKVEAKKEVKKEAPKAKKEEPAKEAAPKAKKEAPKKEKVDYSSMLVTELKELCSERNITGYSTMRKAELIAALEESDK
ncbi:50S ribosomal protein L20 [Tenericutes bacterium MO-XQ]|jgi:large subunit ribosomal protein L20|nr:50S ribosomal protein L20 [Tenericutes bacterium MO-XQ]